MVLLGAPIVGCGDPTVTTVEMSGQTLDVGCGACQFKQPDGRGCYWAVRIDGQIYPMQGTILPSESQLPSHGPEGMCTMTRQAVVDGNLRAGVFTATRFRLLDVDPATAAAAEPVSDHDHDAPGHVH
jgi:hypothetical protein